MLVNFNLVNKELLNTIFYSGLLLHCYYIIFTSIKDILVYVVDKLTDFIFKKRP